LFALIRLNYVSNFKMFQKDDSKTKNLHLYSLAKFLCVERHLAYKFFYRHFVRNSIFFFDGKEKLENFQKHRAT
jgi:hypothetical protein